MSDVKKLSELFKSTQMASSLSGLSMLLVSSLGVPFRLPIGRMLRIIPYAENLNLDLDNLTETAVYVLTTDTLNCPLQSNGSYCLNFVHSTNYRFQIYLSILDSRIAYRTMNASVWGTWRILSFTTKT